IGRSPQALAVDFPSLDLGHLDDVWWHADGPPDARGICVEPVASVLTRAAQFKAYLRARSEQCIAVVGHGTFFFHLTSRTLANCEIADFDLYSGGGIR
ncbi:MAG: histidine phosphatase family protein, partial [Casimicrobiaceae bacterium]